MLQDILDWVPVIGPAFTFALLVFVPGFLVLWSAGLAPHRAFVFAPVTSTALAGGGSVILSVLGVVWSAASFALLSLGAAVIVAGVRLLVQRRAFRISLAAGPARESGSWWVAAGLVANALVVLWLYVRPSGSAENVAYEYDTIWHFSVMRWIVDTGDASSLNTGLLDGTIGNHFYPAAWHALVALAAETSGGSLAASVHGSVLVTLLLIWPLGLVWLFRSLFGARRVGAFAVASAAFLPAVFPVGFLTFGLLYPNFFSYALAPACLAVLIGVLNAIGRADGHFFAKRWVAVAVTVASIPMAIVFAQPNSAFTLLVMLLPLIYLTIARLLSADRIGARPRWLRPLAITAFSAVLVVVWILVHDSGFLRRTVTVETWSPYVTMSQSVGEWLFYGNGTEGQLLLGALTIAGIVLVLATRANSRWWIVSWALVGALFVVSASQDGGAWSLRNYLVGFWYADSTRLAAAGALLGLPLVAFAVDWLVTSATTRPSTRRRFRVAPGAIAGLTMVIVIALTVTGTAMDQRAGSLREKSFTGDAQWVSETEKAFLAEAAEIVGPDAVVANNPFDGSAMGYSLYGIDMLFPALPGNWMGVQSPEQALVATGLDRAADDPQVCAAADELGVRYVIRLEQGARGVFGFAPEMFAGLDVTSSTAGFELVLEAGDLALYRLTACGSS